MQEGHGALRMRCRLENSPLVIRQNLQPRLQVGGMIGPGLELRRNTEIGAEEAASEFGNIS